MCFNTDTRNKNPFTAGLQSSHRLMPELVLVLAHARFAASLMELYFQHGIFTLPNLSLCQVFPDDRAAAHAGGGAICCRLHGAEPAAGAGASSEAAGGQQSHWKGEAEPTSKIILIYSSATQREVNLQELYLPPAPMPAPKLPAVSFAAVKVSGVVWRS